MPDHPAGGTQLLGVQSDYIPGWRTGPNRGLRVAQGRCRSLRRCRISTADRGRLPQDPAALQIGQDAADHRSEER